MGNQQPKKVGRANKTQIDMACLKAKIHLQMMRDRKNQQVIKGQKELVAKIKNKSRNKTQQILVAQRVVNGLKYAGACNMLMAYANSLRGQSQFLAENIGNRQKLEPWLPMIYSLLYSSDHLGLSSLNEVKNALRALNDPMVISNQVNQDIKQLLTPSPSPSQMNIYMVQMSERNNIPLEEINIVGHKFTKDMNPPPSLGNSQFSNMERMLAEKLKNGMGGNKGNQGNQGYGNQGGFGGNQGGYGYGGNQGGYSGGYGGYQNPNMGNGFNNNNIQTNYNQYQQPQQQNQPILPPNLTPGYLNDNVHNQNINPYKGLSNIHDQGPNFYQPSKINNNNGNEKPRQFDNFDDIINPKGNQNNNMDPMYPSVDFSQIKHSPYQPGNYGNKNENQNNNHESQSNNQNSNNEQPPSNPSPTISQLLRSLGK